MKRALYLLIVFSISLNGDAIRLISHGGKPITVEDSSLLHSSVINNMIEGEDHQGEVDIELRKFSYDTILQLVEIVNNNFRLPTKLSPQMTMYLMALADYLDIQRVMAPLTMRLLLNPAAVGKFSLGTFHIPESFYTVPLEDWLLVGEEGGKEKFAFKAYNEVALVAKNIFNVHWAPDGSSFLAATNNGELTNYNENGQRGRLSLSGVRQIFWAPDSNSFFVIFRDRKLKRYSKDGREYKNVEYQNAVEVEWAPDSNYYVVAYQDAPMSILYNAEGKQIGLPIHENSHNVFWAPDSSSFLVHTADRRLVQYSSKGSSSPETVAIDVEFAFRSPENNSFLVQHSDGSLVFYDQDSKRKRDWRLEETSNIFWAPNGDSFLVQFEDGALGHYGKDGRLLESVLIHDVINAYWSPDSSSFLVHYDEHRLVYFDKNSNRHKGPVLEHLKWVDWSSDSSSYWVEFQGEKVALFQEQRLVGNTIKSVDWVYLSPKGKSILVQYENGNLVLLKKFSGTLLQYWFIMSLKLGTKYNFKAGDRSYLAKTFLSFPKKYQEQLIKSGRITIDGSETG